MLGKVFKAYDVRATYPAPLNEATAWKIGFGTAKYLIEQAQAAGETDPMMRHVVVGRDMRPSSPALSKALVEGMRALGAHVIDVGLVDTPFIVFAVNYLDCAGGVQTTASHNPINYNGFKISQLRGMPVGQSTGLEDISKYAAMADKEKSPAAEADQGRFEERDLWDGYRRHVHQFLRLGSKKLRVVVDASNGMAGTMVPRLFDRINGLEIIPMYFENTKGEFVHEPNPLVAANLADLRERVVREKADFGICFDGDADRGIFVDETGAIIGCDHLTAVLAKHFIKQNPGAGVIYDLRSSKAVQEEVEKAGGQAIESRVGHVFMKSKMREHQAVFGGELSGHFYFRDNFNADSGAIIFAVVASVVSNASQSLGEMVKPVARYVQSGEINFACEEKDVALANLQEMFEDEPGVRIAQLDGVTIDCFTSQGWWCNVRKSNTEPLLRLNLESRDESILDRMLAQIAPILGVQVEH